MRGEDFDIERGQPDCSTEMESEARKPWCRPVRPESNLTSSGWPSCATQGQGHEIEIPLPSGKLGVGLGKEIRKRFDRLYQRQYGRTVPNVDVEIINWAFRRGDPGCGNVQTLRQRAKRKAKAGRGSAKFTGDSCEKHWTCPVINARPCARRFHQWPCANHRSPDHDTGQPGFNAAIDKAGNIVLTAAHKKSATRKINAR